MNNKTTIILSTYNESLAVEYTITELIKHIKNLEIVVVDDGNVWFGEFQSARLRTFNSLSNFLLGKKASDSVNLAPVSVGSTDN